MLRRRRSAGDILLLPRP